MGQKVNPHGLRVGVIKDWDSKWYADDALHFSLNLTCRDFYYIIITSSSAIAGLTPNKFTSPLPRIL